LWSFEKKETLAIRSAKEAWRIERDELGFNLTSGHRKKMKCLLLPIV